MKVGKMFFLNLLFTNCQLKINTLKDAFWVANVGLFQVYHGDKKKAPEVNYMGYI